MLDRGIAKVTIESLNIIAGKSVNPHFLRSFVSNITPNGITNITDTISRSSPPGVPGKVSAHMLSGKVGDMLTISAATEGLVGIANGWDTPRARFILNARVDRNVGASELYLIQGYTDYLGIGNGTLDPNMVFFINSFTVVRSNSYHTPAGYVNQNIVANAANVLVPNSFHQDHGVNKSAYLIRPSDIFTGMQTDALVSGGIGSDSSFGSMGIYDNRSALVLEPHTSTRDNLNPTSYVAKTINSYLEAKNAVDMDGEYHDILSSASSHTLDPSLITNPFFSWLMNHFSTAMPTTSFALKDLMQLDPMLSHKTNTVTNKTVHQISGFDTNNFEYWQTQTQETVAAATIFNSLSSIMIENFVTKIGIVATNMTQGMVNDIRVVDVKTPGNADLTREIGIIINRFEREVINTISMNGLMAYRLSVTLNLFSDSYLTIAFENNPEVNYSYASFSDSLVAPVISSNPTTRTNLNNDFEYMLNSVSNNVYVGSVESKVLNPSDIYGV